MTTTAVGRPAGQLHSLPERARATGPVTAALFRRDAAVAAAVWAAALALIAATGAGAWHAVAHGLLVPGGGFLYTGDPLLFALALGAFVVGFVLWFVLGMMVVPFAVWLGAAAGAAARAGGGLWEGIDVGLPLALLAVGALALAARSAAVRRDRRRAVEHNRMLAGVPYVPPRPRPSAFTPAAELSERQLQFQRHILDLGLQPRDTFAGFEWVDQFREAAVRYQLNYAAWSLAFAQAAATPAFTGYVGDAQRNLIEKMTARRVWQYWRWENLWGNLSTDVDPIRRDNIMLSGYYLLMLGLFEATNDDHRYDRPGCLRFAWDERRVFAYDRPTIAATVAGNFACSRYGLFPCEPNWVYGLCNMIGMDGLMLSDAVHGTDLAAQRLDAFRRAVALDLTTIDGRSVTTRASRVGIAVPAMTSTTVVEGGTGWWLSPIMPKEAQRAWILAKARVVRPHPDGGVQLRFLSFVDRIDIGHYKPSVGELSYAFAIATANELGDTETRDGLIERWEVLQPSVLENGARRYPCSTVSNLMLMVGRFGAERTFYDLVNRGAPAAVRRGPRLEEAPYPDALVASATNDGRALHLVLRPGGPGRRVRLGIGRLDPGGAYAVTGGVERDVVAGPDGRAVVHADLDGRTVLRIEPV